MNTLKAVNGTFLLLASVLMAGCGEKSENQSVSPVPVKEWVVSAGAQTVGNHYSGTVETENETSLSFTSGGTIRQLYVKVGDRVRKGQLVASVDPATQENAFHISHAARMQAEDAYQRMKQLFDKGSLSEIKWVEVQSQFEQAVAAEAIAKKNLEDCKLYASADGIVSEKNAEIGQNMAPGMPVVKLVTTAVMNVMVSVPETEIADLTTGQKASIEVPALSNRSYNGRVIEKGVTADPISRSYRVKIRVEDTDGKLLPGMVTNVMLQQAETNHVILVPASLVQLASDNSTFVWVIENGQAIHRTVVCGAYQANGVTIAEGLQEGDRVICEGQQKVCTGTPVTLKQ